MQSDCSITDCMLADRLPAENLPAKGDALLPGDFMLPGEGRPMVGHRAGRSRVGAPCPSENETEFRRLLGVSGDLPY